MKIRFRYEYKVRDNVKIVGDVWQIAEIMNKSVPWVRMLVRQGVVKKTKERNTMYDLMDWETETIKENVPFEELYKMWPVKDVRTYAQNLYDGNVNKKLKMSIVGIKRKPLEVVRL